MGANLQGIPGSVEVSPATVDRDKLHLLRDRGLDRVSIGVQSFIDPEVLAAQRSQRVYQVETALNLMREAGFPTINIDLIYGLPGQTVDSLLQSIRVALQFQAEEIYLYPLYVRPLTGMGKSTKEWDDIRLECYREGRSLLISQGYTQVSMRMFQRPLAKEGLNLAAYHRHFATEAFLDFPELAELLRLGLADRDNQTLRFTEIGMERSDTIGPWLFSEQVGQLMQTYQGQ